MTYGWRYFFTEYVVLICIQILQLVVKSIWVTKDLDFINYLIICWSSTVWSFLFTLRILGCFELFELALNRFKISKFIEINLAIHELLIKALFWVSFKVTKWSLKINAILVIVLIALSFSKRKALSNKIL
jgi:hypothetical protein